MRKSVLLCAMLVLMLPVLFVSSVSAAPKWFTEEGANLYPWASVVEKPRFVPWFEEHPPHRATDPLLVVESLDPMLFGEDPPEEGGRSLDYQIGGWVTFVCESQEGFDFSIDAKGLDSDTTYEVWAFDVLSETPVYLGDISTDEDGEGEIEGVIGVDPGFHVFAISVNLDGTPILQTLPPYTFYNPAFEPIPIPELGISLAEMLWTLGDSADFAVFP